MKSVFALLAKQPPKTFKVSYAPEYKNFIINHVAADPSHPLNETQRRRQAEKKKEGLWWHATTGVDLNKSSCVRAWCRRRLRRAVVDELKARGYQENGKYANSKTLPQRADFMAKVVAGKALDLKGSLRLHVQAPLISAKYVDVRAEVRAVIDAVQNGIKGAPGDHASARPTKSRPSRKSPTTAAAAQRSPLRMPEHAVKTRAR